MRSRNERECRDDSINMNDNDYEEEMVWLWTPSLSLILSPSFLPIMNDLILF